MLSEPLSVDQAKKVILACLGSGGTVSFSAHALREMANEQMTTVDCTNVLRGGVVEPAEWERGSWRYRVRTNVMYVVVAFRSERHLVVVTAWRK